MSGLSGEDYQPLLEAALAEDIGPGDATTLATVPEDATAGATMVARQDLTVAGLPIAEAVFRRLSESLEIEILASEGDSVAAGTALMRISGPARALLTGERTALNFVQRLSGIATLTARHVAAIEGAKARILDTRKTTPGWRKLEKYAVQCGGGTNHRTGLYDLIMIKDNHLAALRNASPNPIFAAVKHARERFPDLQVEVEADTLEQAALAAEAGADIILLDNMPPATLREAVALLDGRCRTEASGGITLDSLRAVADAGVDFISVGALTHSATAVDIALDFNQSA